MRMRSSARAGASSTRRSSILRTSRALGRWASSPRCSLHMRSATCTSRRRDSGPIDWSAHTRGDGCSTRGATIVAGSDAPVEKGDPLIEFYAATYRHDLDGRAGRRLAPGAGGLPIRSPAHAHCRPCSRGISRSRTRDTRGGKVGGSHDLLSGHHDRRTGADPASPANAHHRRWVDHCRVQVLTRVYGVPSASRRYPHRDCPDRATRCHRA